MTQLSDILGYTRVRLNLENNQSVTDPQLTLFVNAALASLDSLLVNTYEDYNIREPPILAVVSTGNTIPLPLDCLKVRGVDFGSPGAWYTIYGYNLIERNRYSNPIAQMLYPYGTNVARRVRVMGGNLYITPQNAAQGQYQIWYTPKFQPLDAVNNPTLPPYMDTQDWLEYAVATTGIKVYNRLNLPTDGLLAEQAMYRDQVVATASNRMASAPKAMSNVREVADYTYPFAGGGWGSD